MTDDELQALLDAATEGPWSLAEGYPNIIGIDGANGEAVVWVTFEIDEGIDRPEDARLIVMAPDLGKEVLRLRAEKREMALQLIAALGQEMERAAERGV